MTSSANSESVTYAKTTGVKTAAETGDRIDHVRLSLAFLPLSTPVSDAQVLTGRQKPLTEVAIICLARIQTTSTRSTPNCCGPGLQLAGAEWRYKLSPLSILPCGI